MSAMDHAHHTDHGHVTAPDNDHSHRHGNLNSMAASATLHCLTGCAIGEIVGLIIGTAAGLGNGATIAISIALAFIFGYSLSTLPLLKAGVALGAALSVVLAADTLSILTMEIVDNLVVAVIPGAMNAGLVNSIFWLSMSLSLVIAFGAAYPVNRYLLKRGKGHALTHEYHGKASTRLKWFPDLEAKLLASIIAAFILGGLVVSIADDLGGAGMNGSQHMSMPGAHR